MIPNLLVFYFQALCFARNYHICHPGIILSFREQLHFVYQHDC